MAKTLLTLLHSEWPKLHRVLAILSAIGLIALRMAKTLLSFGHSECNRVNLVFFFRQFDITAYDGGNPRRSNTFSCSYTVVRNTNRSPNWLNAIFETTINETYNTFDTVFDLDAEDPDSKVIFLLV